jgi:hypothetical protein
VEFCALFFCVESLAFAWLGGLLFSSKSKAKFLILEERQVFLEALNSIR